MREIERDREIERVERKKDPYRFCEKIEFS